MSAVDNANFDMEAYVYGSKAAFDRGGDALTAISAAKAASKKAGELEQQYKDALCTRL